jgi:dTDP-4-amino-4,6-dideoxygalactose transaminase
MSTQFWPLMPNIITLKDKFNLVKFILSTNFFTAGKKVEEFERRWSEWVGAKHSLFVSSGSTANFLLLAAVIETCPRMYVDDERCTSFSTRINSYFL